MGQEENSIEMYKISDESYEKKMHKSWPFTIEFNRKTKKKESKENLHFFMFDFKIDHSFFLILEQKIAFRVNVCSFFLHLICFFNYSFDKKEQRA